MVTLLNWGVQQFLEYTTTMSGPETYFAARRKLVSVGFGANSPRRRLPNLTPWSPFIYLES